VKKLIQISLIALAVFFVLIAIGIWWYKSTAVPVMTTKTDNVYRVGVSSGVWADVGVWVPPRFKIIAESNKPFYLGVGSYFSQEARLVDGQAQRFLIEVWTFHKPTSDLPKPTLWVEDKEKIYLYAEKSTTVSFVLEPLADQTVNAINEKIGREKYDEEIKSRDKIVIALAFLIFIFLTIGVLAFLRKKFKSWES
jgi:hypothetical protein